MTDIALEDSEARRMIGESAHFERDRAYENEKSRAFAWRVAIVAVLAAIALGAAMAILVTRFEPVAFMVVVDKATGETTILKRLGQDHTTFEEAHDKHNLKRFVEAREGYFYAFLQRDYNLVMDMSCDAVGQEYARQFDGDKALDKVWRDGTEARINVASVRLLPDQHGKAVVTFDRIVRIKTTNEIRPPERYTATLSYEYKPDQKKPESTWIENPTGFRVCAYRKDIDLGGAPK